jgi:cytochrome c oxidase cbb3-type subunit 1
MERFMKSNTPDDLVPQRHRAQAVANAAWHALLWLVIADAIGVMLAVLLLFPSLNQLLGEWTYGRWIMVHMNLELYGWTSLPLLGFLFKVYGADLEPSGKWCRPALWVWSTALGVGVLSWLSGYSSGKLFLDWSGYARVLFAAALVTIWILLVLALIALIRDRSVWTSAALVSLTVKATGLVILLMVPLALYAAASPNIYPPVNPDSGGPTGASQLESSLAIVFILLLLPFGLARRKTRRNGIVVSGWVVLVAESSLCAVIGRADISHHIPAQYLTLGSLLVWLALTPVYYEAFEWHSNTRKWRLAFLWWWAALLATGWVFFLPGVLDHFKFTDGLVGHSFVAMAGFTSSFIIFVLVQLLGDGGWILNRTRAFLLWHGSVISYVVVVTIAGWREGFDPAFTIVPGVARNVLYTLRLLTGIAMFLASLDWLVDATTLLREPTSVSIPAYIAQEETACTAQ